MSQLNEKKHQSKDEVPFLRPTTPSSNKSKILEKIENKNIHDVRE